MQCGRIASSHSGGPDSIIVAGGLPGLGVVPVRDAALLDVGSPTWRRGTPLPVGTYAGAGIRDPLGGFVVAGGATELGFAYTSKIYRLRNALPDTRWELLPVTLTDLRAGILGVPVPESFVRCQRGTEAELRTVTQRPF